MNDSDRQVFHSLLQRINSISAAVDVLTKRLAEAEKANDELNERLIELERWHEYEMSE